MKKKFIVVFVLVLLIISGTYLSLSVLKFSGNSQVIMISDKGFTPSKITISKNTRVSFRNVGSKSHWPASDFHPTHGIYPQFDPTVGIIPGKEWSFKFEKPGKWKFHDHLFPELKGLIIVEK